MNFSAKHIVFSLGLMLIFLSGESQTLSRSPFSFFGFGEFEKQSTALQAGMGDLKYGIASAVFINPANPGSFSTINQPSFQLDMASNRYRYTNTGAPEGATSAYFKGFSLGLPITKKVGLAVGISPYTKMGYTNVNEFTNTSLGNVTYRSTGRGGLNTVYGGLGFKLYSDSTKVISFGLSGSYVFGTIDKLESIYFAENSTAYGSSVLKSDRASGFMGKAGITYYQSFSKKLKFTFGSSFQYSDSLITYSNILSRSFTGGYGTEKYKDTAYYGGDTAQSFLPNILGAGFSFLIKSKWMLGMDYSTTVRGDYLVSGKKVSDFNYSQVAFGAQYIPNQNITKGFMKVLNYRIGARYASLPIEVGGEQLREYGMTFGFGAPILKSQSRSMVNLALEFGMRNTAAKDFNEQFVNLSLGFTFAPHKYDRWFVRPKID